MTAKKAAAQPKSTEKMAEVAAGLPTPEDAAKELKSPYPKGVAVFSYQPDAGSDPIVLPLSGFDAPDKLWHFDVAQLPILSQTWKWMERANVPKAIQRQAQLLPDAEYFKMFDQWFDAMKAGKAPAGALSSGK